MATRAVIKQEARMYLDEMVQGRLQDSVNGQFGLDAAVTEAYVEYSKETRCFPASFSCTAGIAITGTGTWTTGQKVLSLTGCVPTAGTIQPGQIFTITGYAGNYSVGNTAATITNGTASVTVSTALPTYSTTSVVSIQAKDTYSYSDFDSSGRLFDVYAAAYDQSPLSIVGREYLDSNYPRWRFDPTGTPGLYIPFGEMQFRLYPKPSSALIIDLEGYQTADLTNFTLDTDSPAIHTSRCKLLSAYAAYIMAIRFAGVPEQEAQQSMCYRMWIDGIKQANKEIHGSNKIDIVVGRNAESNASMWPGYRRGIIQEP